MAKYINLKLPTEEYEDLIDYSKLTELELSQTIRSCILTSIAYAKALPYRVINKREYVIKDKNGKKYKFVLVPRDYTGVILKECDDSRMFKEEEEDYMLIPHPSPSDHNKEMTKKFKKAIRDAINEEKNMDLYLIKNGRKEVGWLDAKKIDLTKETKKYD